MTRYARWLVPAAAVTLIGGGVAASAAASSTPDLPAQTPAELLVAVATAESRALSGTITTEADLGFPQLPGVGGTDSSSDPQALLTRLLAGENTVRVWVDGPDRFRAALVDDFAELQVVGDGTEVWTYSSTENVATRYQLPAEDETDGEERPDADGFGPEGFGPEGFGAEGFGPEGMSPESFTPEGIAGQALAAIDPSTEVTVADPQVVAGRDAYTLVVAPRTEETLVDRIEIAVDAESSLPVQVQVFARGQQAAAFSTGFTSLDLETPEAGVFDFSPPEGATVVEGGAKPGDAPDDAEAPVLPDFGMPQILGSGWASVLELSAPTSADAPAGDDADTAEGDATALLDQLTEPVDGGRAVSTALLSILLTDDGRVLVGAVPVETLVTAAT